MSSGNGRQSGGAAPEQLLVIVADDDEWIRGVIMDVLRDDGIHVVQAPSAEAAIELLGNPVFPVVLLADVNFGGHRVGGLGLAALVRRFWPDVGLLLMSGDDAVASAPGTILAKPFSAQLLREHVSAVARRMQSRPAFFAR